MFYQLRLLIQTSRWAYSNVKNGKFFIYKLLRMKQDSLHHFIIKKNFRMRGQQIVNLVQSARKQNGYGVSILKYSSRHRLSSEMIYHQQWIICRMFSVEPPCTFFLIVIANFSRNILIVFFWETYFGLYFGFEHTTPQNWIGTRSVVIIWKVLKASTKLNFDENF